jgi:ATP-dependent Clp protease ATP-binding subunit ClpA
MSDFSNYNLTPSAKNSLILAQEIASEFGHLKVIDIHLMYSILDFDHANIDFTMQSCAWIKEGLKTTLCMVLEKYTEPKRKRKIFAPEIYEILDEAKKIASKNKDEFIGIDHVLLAMLLTRDLIIDFLTGCGLPVKTFCKVLDSCIKYGIDDKVIPKPNLGVVPTSAPQAKKQSIGEWCENINNTIKERNTFEIFGREEETQRAFEVLLRKNKRNVILVGDAGVGKTAIVEGIAEKIIQKKCPSFFLNKQILSLDMTSVLAGTMYRGQMEEKVKAIIDEISNNKDYILFIDEIHTIVGAGNSEGSLDLANSLKPVLSRGNFSCIGATTKDEYDKYFKGDSALNRRFEKIDVFEPNKEDTLELIKKAKKSYEKFHAVKFNTRVLKSIMELCDSYLPEKKFPDKAFDILDEAGAKTKINNEGETVKLETIYEIFSKKLNCSVENIKKGSNISMPGRIGF